jgi:sterol desaturase/sphingolipid hydroxylase (fatty acid hydroxylase superfamily)
MHRLTLPTVLTVVVTSCFLVLERVRPGRALPHSPGWYARALLLNGVQLAFTLGTRFAWLHLFGGWSILRVSAVGHTAALEGLLAWLASTFFYYWWHRLRHASGFWRVFHQIHHSPARIELITSFYKHPVEILSDVILSGLIAYPLLGVSLQGAFWLNFFAATGEYFYHANFKSPRWLRYLIQTPELHSIHHELDVHRGNYSDLPLWDRLFGTYRDTVTFAPQCGFPRDNERFLGAMLRFEDVYNR